MCIETEEQLLRMQEIGKIVATAREEMLARVKPGITTAELDRVGDEVLQKYGARSAPRSEYQFPGATCISLNHVAAHGIPGHEVIHQGDLLNIDVSAEKNGYYADTGVSMVVPPGKPELEALVEVSRNALRKAIDQARTGNPINLIGGTIQDEARKNGYTVLKNLTGHGIGRNLHEEPRHILNYYEPWDNEPLKEGMALAIETFVSTGAEYAHEMADGWSLTTMDDSLVAQFEHTIIVTSQTPIILTQI